MLAAADRHVLLRVNNPEAAAGGELIRAHAVEKTPVKWRKAREGEEEARKDGEARRCERRASEQGSRSGREAAGHRLAFSATYSSTPACPASFSRSW